MPPASSEKNNASQKLFSFSLYSFFALLVITPLIFSKQIESSFELAKKSALILFGGIFIIFTIIYLLAKIYGKKSDDTGIFIDKKFDPAIAVFLSAALLSTIFSIKPYVSFHGQYMRQIGFITFLYVFAVYFFSSQILKDKSKVDLTLTVIELTGAFTALYALLQYFHLDPLDVPLSVSTRPVSTFGHNTFASGFMVMILPFSLIRIFRDKKPYTGMLFSAIFICGIVITQSRTSYVAALAVLTLLLVFYPFIYKSSDKLKFKKILKINLSVIFCVIAALALLAVLLPSNPFVERLIHVMDLPKSARWILWRDSIEAFKLHPFTGSGIAAFPSVFEYFMSYELRALEPRNYFDHAHNVFIHTLVTMGIAGTAAYLFMLFLGFASSLRAYFNSSIEKDTRLFFLAASASLTGYVIYSLANFEDTTILLYLFVIFALMKVMYSKCCISVVVNNSKIKNSFIYAVTVFSAGAVLYCGYNFYVTYNNYAADVHFKAGKELYFKGEVKGSIDELNKSVTLNYGCAEYKYTLANYVQGYCLQNRVMSTESKNNLLHQAEEELERAKPNFFSHLQYQAMRSLIKLQQGDFDEAERLRLKVFAVDSLILNYRNNLARFYFVTGDIPRMKNELKAVQIHDQFNTDAALITASYYLSVNDKKNALITCDNLLAKYPLEPLVNKLKEQILNTPDIKKTP